MQRLNNGDLNAPRVGYRMPFEEKEDISEIFVLTSCSS